MLNKQYLPKPKQPLNKANTGQSLLKIAALPSQSFVVASLC